MENLNSESKENNFNAQVEVLSNINDEQVSEIIELDKKIFPIEMAVPEQELLQSLKSEGVQVVLRNEKGEMVGYITSLPHNDALHLISEFDSEFSSNDSALYIESIGIEKSNRSLTNFNTLLQTFVREARAKGFKTVTAHTRVSEGLSNIVQNKFHAKNVRRIENWGGFGEPFDYLEVDISKED